MYKTYLNKALNSLFKPVSENGFWDEKEQRIIERLYHTEDWNWQYTPSKGMRYMVFCLSNILLAKEIFNLDTKQYDKKIRQSILYLNDNKAKLSISDLTYGALCTIYLQEKYYNIENVNWEEWKILLKEAIDKSLNRRDNHDSLVLIAGKYALKKFNDEEVKNKLLLLVEKYLRSQNQVGFFETGDIRGNYHQRNMYVLWGLLAAADFYPEKREEIKRSVKLTLDWIWNSRRQKIDNAFLWHPAAYLIKGDLGVKLPILNMAHSKYLFECHQTFFCNAVNFYQKQFNTQEYDKEKVLSIDWIISKNRIGKNLVDVTGIDLPIRIMHTNGDLFIKNQNFKGTYEIGSYILALAALSNK